jgi:hypothetical protein
MIDLSFHFTSTCWLWQAEKAAWHFISLPKEQSEEIKFFNDNLSHKKRGWGSVRVEAKIGETRWKTSIFPQTKEGVYLLPIKAEVRKKEKILAGEKVDINLTILV